VPLQATPLPVYQGAFRIDASHATRTAGL